MCSLNNTFDSFLCQIGLGFHIRQLFLKFISEVVLHVVEPLHSIVERLQQPAAYVVIELEFLELCLHVLDHLVLFR